MAARYKDEVYTGVLHSDCSDAFRAAHPEFVRVSEQDVGLEMGYVTSQDRFVGREEALEIAHRADQLKEGVIQRRSRLLSDDLKQNSGEKEE